MRPEYRGDERVEKPYPGLKVFYDVRTSRDTHFDQGPPPGRLVGDDNDEVGDVTDSGPAEGGNDESA